MGAPATNAARDAMDRTREPSIEHHRGERRGRAKREECAQAATFRIS